MSVYVGPARVLSVEPDGRPRVQVLGGACETTTADWALPFRFQPHRSDLLLVIGQNGRYWVTGIVHGKGDSLIAFRGDTELRAKGTLALGGSGGVRLDSPNVRIETEQLAFDAAHVVQRVGDIDSEVTGTIDERSGSCTRIIDGDDDQTAFRHSTVAKHKVKIDGALLRLS